MHFARTLQLLSKESLKKSAADGGNVLLESRCFSWNTADFS